jgi:hypothetical protein
MSASNLGMIFGPSLFHLSQSNLSYGTSSLSLSPSYLLFSSVSFQRRTKLLSIYLHILRNYFVIFLR